MVTKVQKLLMQNQMFKSRFEPKKAANRLYCEKKPVDELNHLRSKSTELTWKDHGYWKLPEHLRAIVDKRQKFLPDADWAYLKTV